MEVINYLLCSLGREETGYLEIDSHFLDYHTLRKKRIGQSGETSIGFKRLPRIWLTNYKLQSSKPLNKFPNTNKHHVSFMSEKY